MTHIYEPIYSGIDWENKVNKTIDKMDKLLSKDQIVFYLMFKLSPYFQRDLNYFLSDDNKKYEMYKNGYKCDNKGIIVCRDLCEYYCDLLKYFNIKSKVILASVTNVPHYALIIQGNNQIYFMDIINGLVSWQYSKEYNYYGRIPGIEKKLLKNEYKFIKDLDLNYVNSIARSISADYYKKNGEKVLYFKQLLEKNGGWDNVIKQQDKIESINQQIMYISKHFINLGQVNGAVERKLMYMYLFNTLLKYNDFKNTQVKIWRNNDHDINDVNIKVIYTYKEKNIEYIEDKQNEKFVLIRKK